VVIDFAFVHMLAAVVPCPRCEHGLCQRCWVVARAVEHLAIAQRRDQAVDELRMAA
jgi:hypothetical protein